MSRTTSFLDTTFPSLLLISDVLIYVPVRLAIIPLVLSSLSALMDGSTFLIAFGPAEAYFLSFSPSGCFTSSEEGFSSAFSDFSAIFCTAHFCASSFVIPSLSIYPSLLLSSFSSVSMFLPLLNTPEKLLSFSPIILILSSPSISPLMLLISFISPSILSILVSFPSSFISLSALSFPMLPVISPFALFIFFPLRFTFPDVLI